VNGPDNDLWFTMTNTNGYGYIAEMPTGGGLTTQYRLPFGTNPLGVTVGPDGDLWTVDHNYGGAVYRMNDTGGYSTITLDKPNAIPSFIVSDPVNKVVWLGEHDQNLNAWITKIDMNGNETDYALPTPANNIYTLTQGPDDNIYFIYGDGAQHDYIGKITSTGTITTTDLGAYHGAWYIRAGLDDNLWATDYSANEILQITTNLVVTTVVNTGLSAPLGLATGSDGNMWFTQWNGDEISKVGEGNITTQYNGQLTFAQDIQLGLSTLVTDTSGDGIPDYVKSPWNPNRQAEFCNATGTDCTYPDLFKPNIYLTIDWMVRPIDNLSFQPSDAEMESIQQAFAFRGIDFHYDTGQYGGGQEVPYNQYVNETPTLSPSVFDYMNGGDGIPAEFPTIRRHIWHYMLSGDYMNDASGNPSQYTAFSYVGGDTFFVAYGNLNDNGSSSTGWDGSLADAISGSTMHELGHNLCLTSDSADGQPADCVFTGVDSTSIACSVYASSMNYNCQLNTTNYSNGQNGSNDHNDWAALDISEFTSANDSNTSNGAGPTGKKGKKLHVVHDGATHGYSKGNILEKL
jgi:hypothetical protein